MSSTAPPRVLLASLDAATVGAAVQASRSWRQVLLALGLESHRHVRQLRVLCDQGGVAYEHLGYRAPPDDLLREVLSRAQSWPEAMSGLGFAENSGSARETVRKHAVRLGLDLRHLTARPSPRSVVPSMQPDLRHLRHAGSYLAAAAFVLAGHRVSWPLEPAPYDLVVDTGERLLRVQVKTSSRLVGGVWTCGITRSEYADVAGGKRKVRYSPDEVDAFAVVDGAGEVYVIPIEDVVGLTHLSLRHYANYRIPRLAAGPDAVEPESG